ncbi:site-specific DNA-methyltransferase [Candidatus Methylomirabilis sp.]|uniref:site-specific DNA-methyltransferase n=1 Tax=Candidatus Methylomirabilis sp. TaxID=2032687 RepID=UPI003C762B23
MNKKHKLELTWIGKENQPKLEPRILLEDPEKSYHAKHRVTDKDIFDNRLIFGDNLLALKALEQEFAGKVKCVFIDPPYNTGSAFTHYDDGVEHSIWLSLMRDRLEIIRRLLAEDGSLWITIDDNEAHYLKVLCDEVFGRANFVSNVVWQKRISPDSDAQFLSGTHDHLIVVAKDISRCSMNRLPRTEEQDDRYQNPDNDPRGPWTSSDLTRREYREHDFYPIKLPSGRKVWPARGRSWSVPRDSFETMVLENRIYFGPNGDAMPRRKRFLSEIRGGLVPTTWWASDVAKNEDGRKELKALFPEEADVFATPKPEALIHRVITLATNPNDLVLDSFAGSGTTGAVAHKMSRRWIMVELGEHCHTHIIPRLRKVIDGEDPGGITQAVGWKGGGGFRYYRLAPSLLEKDKWGNWVINKDYNAAMLAEAMCKLEGFTYAPSDMVYWQHGHSTERDFIYVTTANLSHEQLQQLSDEVGPERSLLVLCTAFRGRGDYSSLTVKKIPKQVLSRCEWGHDDYSLRVENLPEAPSSPPAPLPRAGEGRMMPGQQGLFDGED